MDSPATATCPGPRHASTLCDDLVSVQNWNICTPREPPDPDDGGYPDLEEHPGPVRVSQTEAGTSWRTRSGFSMGK